MQTTKPAQYRRFSDEEIARLKAVFQPGDVTPLWDEKPYRGRMGNIVGGCEHVLDFEMNQNRAWEKANLIIGGLDAHLCRICSCWWFDAEMRLQLLSKRGGFSESIRDNERGQ